ncbi:hypothetical protein [Lacinutrix jangbogonensis]|nr:hypothetical protein [Lacinutrix jangbogonensis]
MSTIISIIVLLLGTLKIVKAILEVLNEVLQATKSILELINKE